MTKKLPKPKRQRQRVGDVVQIDLGGGYLAFGRVLENPDFAFYDIRAKQAPPLEAILRAPVAFRVWVFRAAVTSGRWRVIGTAPLEAHLSMAVPYFKRGSISGKGEGLYVYSRGEERPATREECETLEVAAVWAPEHVEDRLRDHFAGRPCRWVAGMRTRELDAEQ